MSKAYPNKIADLPGVDAFIILRPVTVYIPEAASPKHSVFQDSPARTEYHWAVETFWDKEDWEVAIRNSLAKGQEFKAYRVSPANINTTVS